jgi:SAM-dependent methyltransferase
VKNEYNEATFGDRISEIYDSWHPQASAEMTTALKDIAGAGPVLELGIGTGRVALPLAEQGLEVHGIDASRAMVAKMRAKPGGDRLPVTIGNFAEVAVDPKYSLVFVVFNTFFALSSQEEQVGCFANVARRLSPGGRFLIEAFVLDLSRFTAGQCVQATRVDAGEVRLEASRHDRATQRVSSHQILIGEDGIQLYPVQVRYAWPAELDLMARLAGMRLGERWSNWRREPFTGDSTNHIAVYELIA